MRVETTMSVNLIEELTVIADWDGANFSHIKVEDEKGKNVTSRIRQFFKDRHQNFKRELSINLADAIGVSL